MASACCTRGACPRSLCRRAARPSRPPPPCFEWRAPPCARRAECGCRC
jgi:hypothetical protein